MNRLRPSSIPVILAAIFIVALCASSSLAQDAPSAASSAPLRVAVAGLVHGHVAGFLRTALHRRDIQIVGVYEPDQEVARRYVKQFNLDPKLLFTNLDQMLQAVNPQAVLTYTNTLDHRMVVETCARRGVPVMMEKPLAVSLADARAMRKAAAEGHIQVLVNYETTWYRSNREAYDLLRAGALGDARKIVVHDGHRGPKEINVQPEFLAWLTDPKLNGAGALFDFGCYGADLATWLMDGQRPQTVTAVTQHLKPEVYPRVDDEATIIVTYPHAQVIIQASWNWPFDRKDMEVYGQMGYAITVARDDVRVRLAGEPKEQQRPAKPLPGPEDDPIHYLRAVVLDGLKLAGLSSLETNVTVTEILDAARRSANSGRTITLPLK